MTRHRLYEVMMQLEEFDQSGRIVWRLTREDARELAKALDTKSPAYQRYYRLQKMVAEIREIQLLEDEDGVTLEKAIRRVQRRHAKWYERREWDVPSRRTLFRALKTKREERRANAGRQPRPSHAATA